MHQKVRLPNWQGGGCWGWVTVFLDIDPADVGDATSVTSGMGAPMSGLMGDPMTPRYCASKGRTSKSMEVEITSMDITGYLNPNICTVAKKGVYNNNQIVLKTNSQRPCFSKNMFKQI